MVQGLVCFHDRRQASVERKTMERPFLLSDIKPARILPEPKDQAPNPHRRVRSVISKFDEQVRPPFPSRTQTNRIINPDYQANQVSKLSRSPSETFYELNMWRARHPHEQGPPVEHVVHPAREAPAESLRLGLDPPCQQALHVHVLVRQENHACAMYGGRREARCKMDDGPLKIYDT